MDAFAVSICKGLAMKRRSLKACIIVGAWFGGFQVLMPLFGYYLGVGFADSIRSVDHWIAFLLLGFIGIKMIIEAVKGEEEADGSLAFKSMLILAVATSIDALAAGVTFAFLEADITAALIMIGITTFTLSAAGVIIGNAFGTRFKNGAELAGGIILVLLGIKILLEHLGVF